MKYLLGAPLFLALVAASAPPVSVIAGKGDWSNLPPIVDNGTDHQSKNLMLALNDIATKHECALPGYKGDRFDFNMSFAALFDDRHHARQGGAVAIEGACDEPADRSVGQGELPAGGPTTRRRRPRSRGARRRRPR